MTFTILLVDDNLDHRFLIRRALKPLEVSGEVTVHVAEDGEVALALLRRGIEPSLVLLDIKMPRLDGFEVLAEVRRDPRWKSLPIVMLTSSENKSDVERALSQGADDYLTKPLDAREFQEKVRALVLERIERHRSP